MKQKNSSMLAFIIVWVGQLTSNIGTGLTAFALGVYVFKQTHSAAYYSLVILAALLPSVVLKPIGGVLADRFDRRMLMIIGDAGSISGILFIIAMMLYGVQTIWPIYVGSIISSLFGVLHNPAYKASITDLVDEEQYSKASGLVQLAESSKFIISPVVAGLLLAFFNIVDVLLIDCCTFLIAVITVLWVKRSLLTKITKKTNEKFLAALTSGFSYVYTQQGLFALLLVTILITFFVGVLQALWGPLILSFASAHALGVCVTISAMGMLVSSLVIGVFSKSHNKIPILAKALFIAGIFFALMGISANIILITLFGFLFFLTLPFINTSLDVLIRRNIEHHLQGRVWSVVSLISQSGMLIALAAAGFLADHVFNPWLLPNGLLSSNVGRIIGVGAGRGIGLMLIIAGLFISMTGIIIVCMRSLKSLDISEEPLKSS